MYFTSFFSSFREVYQQSRYIYISIFSAILLYTLNPIFRNFTLLRQSFSFKLLANLILYYHTTASVASLGILITLAVLTGIVVSFSVFLLERQIATGTSMGLSVFISVVAPACHSCAFGLLGLLGLSGFIGILPFEGLEIGVVSIFLVLFSLLYLGKKIETKVCSLR